MRVFQIATQSKAYASVREIRADPSFGSEAGVGNVMIIMVEHFGNPAR